MGNRTKIYFENDPLGRYIYRSNYYYKNGGRYLHNELSPQYTMKYEDWGAWSYSHYLKGYSNEDLLRITMKNSYLVYQGYIERVEYDKDNVSAILLNGTQYNYGKDGKLINKCTWHHYVQYDHIEKIEKIGTIERN